MIPAYAAIVDNDGIIIPVDIFTDCESLNAISIQLSAKPNTVSTAALPSLSPYHTSGNH